MATDIALYLNDDRTSVRFTIADLDTADHGELIMDLTDLLVVIAMLTQAAVELSNPTEENSDEV